MLQISSSRLALLPAVLAASACVTAPAYVPNRTPAEVQQWRIVTSEAPLIGAALLESLLALSEDDPFTANQARAQAIELARRAGVVAAPYQTCTVCEPPKDNDGLQQYLVCLAERLNCLRSR